MKIDQLFNVLYLKILISVASIIEAVASGQSESSASLGDSQLDSSSATIESQPDIATEGATLDILFRC